MRIDPNALSSSAASRGNGETILVIEDEPGVREMVRMLLEFRGYRALVAENGTDGLALYRQHLSSVKAVVTDMRMPTMHGVQVIEGLRLINPNARIVVMSGVIDANSKFTEEPGRLAFLPKPMTSTELVNALLSVLADPTPPQATASTPPSSVSNAPMPKG